VRKAPELNVAMKVSKSKEIGLSWSKQQRSFIIALPKSVIHAQSYMLSFFRGSLVKVFDEKILDPATSSSNTNAIKESAEVDDWADVAVDNTTGNPAVVELSQPLQKSAITQPPPASASAPGFDMVPDVDTLYRPDEILLKPPYHLIVYSRNNTHVEVQCSHSPTLQFLSDYLKKWCRTNHNDTRRVDLPLLISYFAFYTPESVLSTLYPRSMPSTFHPTNHSAVS
jgi:hypothetical protein